MLRFFVFSLFEVDHEKIANARTSVPFALLCFGLHF
jgi:hypothetical protein